MAFGSVPVRKRAGARKTQVTLHSSLSTVDTMGGQPEGNYTQFGTDDAAKEEIPFVVNATEHGMLYKFTVRYRADLITQFHTSNKRVRVTDDAGSYNVLEIENPEGRNIELVMHCAPV